MKLCEFLDQLATFSEKLIDWYLLNHRDLPWRKTSDPYAIWLSETILQQTRVSQGLAYYFRFLERFPDVFSLAKANQEEVLALWQGLGYYSRGRNLHATAIEIVNKYNGIFPNSHSELLSLKGIGQYTAAAICSFAYHQDYPVFDGNVMRVITRIFEIGDDIRKPETKGNIEFSLHKIFPKGQSYLFNQAIMELGALICLPQNPKCQDCPVNSFCQAKTNNSQREFPFKSRAPSKKRRFLNYLLVNWANNILFRIRVDGIWKGLYEPILFEDEKPYATWSDFAERAVKEGFPLPEKIQVIGISIPKKQLLTHQELWITTCEIEVLENPDWPGTWVKEEKIGSIPKPVFFLKFFEQKSR